MHSCRQQQAQGHEQDANKQALQKAQSDSPCAKERQADRWQKSFRKKDLSQRKEHQHSSQQQ